ADDVAAIDEAEPDDDEPLDSIKGIGPAYSDRLHDAGITSISELADGDAEAIGDEISVSPKTVSNWIERANDR
ncbi:MAG: helix-hairpin-helix domain-containing protein, partial [Halonotius sp.]